MELEKIKEWDGVSDTGKDVRLKLERNFTKIQTAINNLQDISNEKGSLSIRKTYTDYEAMMSDTEPLDELTGLLLEFGQLVCLHDPDDTSNNGFYRYLASGWDVVMLHTEGYADILATQAALAASMILIANAVEEHLNEN
jgi:hypothetical protein